MTAQTITPTEPVFMLPSQLDVTPGGSGAVDPGWVPGVEYDGYRRYLLPVPGGDPTELTPWTRVTTITGMLTSQEGLRVWSERNIARGIGLRADLRAALAADPDDKATQDEVIATAKEVTGDGAAARHGRAVHRGIEHWATTGAIPPGISPSEEIGRDVIAGVECLALNGVKVELVERVVVHSVCGYAGRLDALWRVTLPDGRQVLRIGDVKTGKELEKAEKRHVMGAQLGAYVNATHMYDPTTRTYVPLPAVLDRTVGYILSVRDGTAQLYEIDLTAGWMRMLTGIKLHQDRRASVGMLPVGSPVTIRPSALRDAAPGSSMPGPDEWAPHTIPDTELPGMWERADFTGGAPDTVRGPDWEAGAQQAGAARLAAIVKDVIDTVRDGAGVALTETGRADAAAVTSAIEHGRPGATEEAIGRLRAELRDTLIPVAPAKPAPPVTDEAPRTATGRKRRTCSKCRKPGHWAKNCPGVDAQQDPQPVDEPVDSTPAVPTPAPMQVPVSMTTMLDIGRTCDGGCGAGWAVPAWSSRPDITVCGACGLPSPATLERVRGERAGLSAPVAPPDAPPTLVQEIRACTSQEGLGALWMAHQHEWTEEHTAAAQAMVSSGLPVLPPS